MLEHSVLNIAFTKYFWVMNFCYILINLLAFVIIPKESSGNFGARDLRLKWFWRSILALLAFLNEFWIYY